MLAVGILGSPFLGYMQEMSTTEQLRAMDPALYQQVTMKQKYLLGDYEAIDPAKSAATSPKPVRKIIFFMRPSFHKFDGNTVSMRRSECRRKLFQKSGALLLKFRVKDGLAHNHPR